MTSTARTANVKFGVPNIVEPDQNFQDGFQKSMSQIDAETRTKIRRLDTKFSLRLRIRAEAYSRWALLHKAILLGMYKQRKFLNALDIATQAKSGQIDSVNLQVAKKKALAKEKVLQQQVLKLLQRNGPMRNKIEQFMQYKAYSEHLQKQRAKRGRMGDDISIMERKIVEICSIVKINHRTNEQCHLIIEFLQKILFEDCTLYSWLEHATETEKLTLANRLQYTVVFDNEPILWQGSWPRTPENNEEFVISSPKFENDISHLVHRHLSQYDLLDIENCCHLILSGSCDIHVNKALSNRKIATFGNEGKKITTIHHGQLFGDTALYFNDTRNATVIANGNCELLCLAKKDFNEIMRHQVSKTVDQTCSDLEHFEPFEMLSFQKSQINNVIRYFRYTKLNAGQLLQVKGKKQTKIHFLLTGACREYIPNTAMINSKNGAIVSKKLKKRESTDTLTFFGVKTNRFNRNNSGFLRPQTAKSSFDKRSTNFQKLGPKSAKYGSPASQRFFTNSKSKSMPPIDDNDDNTQNVNSMSTLYHTSNILKEHKSALKAKNLDNNSPLMHSARLSHSKSSTAISKLMQSNAKHDILTIGQNSMIGSYYGYYNIIPETNIECVSNGLALTIETQYLKTFLGRRTKYLFQKTIERDFRLIQNRLHSVKSLISMPLVDVASVVSNSQYQSQYQSQQSTPHYISPINTTKNSYPIELQMQMQMQQELHVHKNPSDTNHDQSISDVDVTTEKANLLCMDVPNAQKDENVVEDEKIEVVLEPKVEITRNRKHLKINKKIKQLIEIPKIVEMPRSMSAKNLGVMPLSTNRTSRSQRFSDTLRKWDERMEQGVVGESVASTSRFSVPCWKHETLKLKKKRRKKMIKKKQSHDNIASGILSNSSSNRSFGYTSHQLLHSSIANINDTNLDNDACQVGKQVYKLLNTRMKMIAADFDQNLEMTRRKYYSRYSKDAWTQRRVSHRRPTLKTCATRTGLGRNFKR